MVGSGDTVVLLLHGMVAAGNSFGAAYDALGEHATVVVPDLLGFGGSMHTTQVTDAAGHIAAIDLALAELGLSERRTLVAGHSMGGSLALRWAAAHTDRVVSVVTFGAPLYLDRAEAADHVQHMGRMESALAGDGRLPRIACALMCRFRTPASWFVAAIRPGLPVPIARSGVRHTWSSYTASLNGIIRDTGWYAALGVLGEAGVPVTLAAGATDPVPVNGRAVELARTWSNLGQLVHPSADHGLPLTHPQWCQNVLADELARTTSA